MQNKRAVALALGCIAIFMVLTLMVVRREEAPEARNDTTAIDLRKHPVYSAYSFQRNQKIIHFGTQPLTAFMGNIGELLRRDSILQGELAKLGYELRIHAFLKGRDLGFFVREGDVHGGMLGDMPTLILAASAEIVVPALSGEGFASIVAKRRMLIPDLRGRRVGIAFGSAAHCVLMEALGSCGMNAGDVRLVFVEGDAMPFALQRGEVDAFAGWEPPVSFALNLVSNSAVIHRSRYAGFTCFRKDFAESHPAAVRLILAAQVRALRWIWRDKKDLALSCRWTVAETEKLAEPSYNLSSELLAQIISDVRNMNLIPVIPESDLKPNGHLHRMFDFVKGMGFIPSQVEWGSIRKVFDRSTMTGVLSNPHTYRLTEFEYRTGVKQ